MKLKKKASDFSKALSYLVADNIKKKNRFRHDFLAVVTFHKWYNSEKEFDY